MKIVQIVKIGRFLFCYICTVIIILHSTGWVKLPILERLDNIFYDLRLKNTLPNSIDERIVIIDIDEKSIRAEGRFPWPRNKLSYLVDILFDYYNIDLLAFDIAFTEADNSSGLQLLQQLSKTSLSNNKEFHSILDNMRSQLAFDHLFAQSLKNRPIVLGFFASHLVNPIDPNTLLPPPVSILDSSALTNSLYPAKSYGANLRVLQENAQSGGFFNNLSVDDDGVNRKIPLLFHYQNHAYEALSLAIYRLYLNSPPLTFITSNDYGPNELDKRLEALQIQNYKIPVDNNGAILIPYRGKQGSFRYISATDILNAVIEPEELENKIIIVGTTAAGLFDLRSTPVQNIYPGVEIHANIVSALLDKTIKSKPGFITGFELIELIFISTALIHFLPKLSVSKATLLVLLLSLLLIITNLLLWLKLDINSNLANPILLLWLLYGTQLFFGYLFESHRKKKLGAIFGQYIPPELVEQMSHSDEEFSLKGENRELSVLFSDIRGFTTISENLEPHELCELINEILTPITAIIHNKKGTIDKYIGDAVMAFWGAPVHDSNHSKNAVEAALAILPELANIQAEFKARDWPYIDIGIGINTGSMSVGNMGSQFRIAYTVMGDNVNLGSRLEGLTKHYGVKIIVSESTKIAAPEFVYCELDRVLVKGKRKPIIIYEPIAHLKDIEKSQLKYLCDLNNAFFYYYCQNWEQALLLFGHLNHTMPEVLLHSIYLDRIEFFKKSPPSLDWNGIFEHTSK